MSRLATVSLFTMAFGLLPGSAISDCENREAHVISNTTYDPGVACGGTVCPQSSHESIIYTCQTDPGTMCVDRPLMVRFVDIIWTCVDEECHKDEWITLGPGKITMPCP